MRLFEVAFSFCQLDWKQKNSNSAIRRLKNKPFRTHKSICTCLINPRPSRHIPLPSVRESCIAASCVVAWYCKKLCTCPPHFGSLPPNDTSSDTIPRASKKQRTIPLQNCHTARALLKRSAWCAVTAYSRSSFWNGSYRHGRYGKLNLNPADVLYRRFELLFCTTRM